MIYTRYWYKVGLAGVVAVAAGVSLVAFTRPPAMTTVAVLTQSVPAMQSIPKLAVHWTKVSSPPPNAITSNMSWGSLVASQSLAPGTVLTTADFSTPQANGLHPGEVQWLVPVSAASSGLPTLGQRVDVWNNNNGSFQAVAYGVRVIGLYSGSGGPVGGSSSTNPSASGPGMVGLAIPSVDMGTMLDVKSPYLVVDPNQAGFHLATPPVSTALIGSTASSPTSARANKASKPATLPSGHGG